MSGGVHCGGVLLSTVAKEKEVSGGNFRDFFFSGADIMPLHLLLAPPRLSLMSLEKSEIYLKLCQKEGQVFRYCIS